VAGDRRSGGLPRRDWLAWAGVGTALVTALGAMISVAVSYSGANEQTELTRQGQFTDRYSKAVEQLGRPGVSAVTVRLGGIYALQRLALDSKDDKGTIIAVLAAFVRDPAGHPTSTPPQNAEPPSLPTDVAAALAVLNRIGGLPGADLHDATLRRAQLTGTNLRLAYLYRADLTGAYLARANLTRAYLIRAILARADLTEADLTDADLPGANLTHADLTGANLPRANLRGADLTGANLIDADLRGADLTGANLTDADLRDANLTGVKGFS
jgi:hypothetical protein